ncbi:hypothetical protein J2848_006540 [Azospirillum lipoferum]|uniref:Uncharacterized protein n=1 Tax=Azospirillum lipoferum TaxID=193 RepID=A0A5A9GDJ9_AZOLI|nr:MULTISPECIES: hypothetical protein [Azospirillum]KAA0591774.1 hypothetical protein FZ942_30840 [Azospirillum lipoferum]MCP1614831.1 hypothetical protein [Azospirillum lipoferum]MDW5536418.1 hypothetical protein [Azospirillum sp. NL1]
MTSLILMTIMAISLVATTGYTAYTMVDASNRVSQAQRSAADMHRLAALVEANLRVLDNDGVASPPAPEDPPPRPASATPAKAQAAGGKAASKDPAQPAGTLPRWLMPGTRTPWGAVYGYCVFAPASERAAPQLRTAVWPAGAAGGGRSYVAAAPAAPVELARAGVIAAIVAPPIGSTTLPDCAALTVRDGRIEVPEGSAVAVTRGASADLAALAASATVTRHVAPTAQGDATGTSQSDAMTLSAALGHWQATRPSTMVLRLAPGRHELPAAQVQALAADPGGSRAVRLVLKAEGPGVVVATNPPDMALRLPTDVRIENIGFEMPVEALPGTQLTLVGDNAISTNRAAGLRVAHARLDVAGGRLTVSAPGGDGVLVDGGTALFRDAAVEVTVGAGRSALVSSLGAGVTFTAETRRPRLQVHGRGLPMAALRSGGGQAILDRTDVSVDNGTPFGIVIENGQLEMKSSVIGGPAARPGSAGVLDLGGSHAVADPNSHIWSAPGGRCAQGALFTQQSGQQQVVAGEGVRGVSGAAASGAALPSVANRASWTCRS